jgi:hypothetical protein
MNQLQPTDSFLTRLRTRPHARALLIFLSALLTGFLVWPLVSGVFSALFRTLCTLVLAPLSFGHGGHVAFTSASGAEGLERAASWDVRMVLGIEGVAKAHAVALNPRRLFYLPLLTLLAGVLAMPLPGAARRRALLVGVPMLIALALSTVWLTAAFLFAQVPGLVYTLSPVESGLLRLGYEGFATPLTTKFMLSLLLTYGLFAWQSRRLAPLQPSAPGQSPNSPASPKSNKNKPAKRKRRKGAAGARHS